MPAVLMPFGSNDGSTIGISSRGNDYQTDSG